MSSCLGRAAVPVKRVWRGLLGRWRRTSGKLSTYVPVNPEDDQSDDDVGVGSVLGRLRKEVRMCEYHDVHVMWEMLSGLDRGGGRDMADVDAAVSGKGKGAPATRRTRRRRGRKHAPWSRLVAYCCAF